MGISADEKINLIKIMAMQRKFFSGMRTDAMMTVDIISSDGLISFFYHKADTGYNNDHYLRSD